MFKERFLAAIALCFSISVIPSHAASPSPLPIGKVAQDSARYAGRQMAVIGILQFDAGQYPYFFADRNHASKDDPAKGLDLGIPVGVKFDDSLLDGPHCVEIWGDFHAYTDQTIVLGHGRSGAGKIDVSALKPRPTGCT